ncbi:MAG TPA: endonuclease III [Candidatus Excrementavichristensenella intestinipullorum]|nr:endonuclease III [Candidatus Excrementavichristensenella intestinipullorum]
MDVRAVLDALNALYPQARAELHFSNPFETLIATILSAQCTDKRVNMVTETLFQRYPDAAALGSLTPEQLEPMIKSCGLYHTKARNIVAACRALVEQYGGQVPSTRQELMKLPGVGQKTAGVVLLAAFGEDQIPVDTHVFRVANRIGLVHEPTAQKTEQALRAVLPKEEWSHAHHLLIWHGRRCCAARKPACERCPLNGGLCMHGEREGQDE